METVSRTLHARSLARIYFSARLGCAYIYIYRLCLWERCHWRRKKGKFFTSFCLTVQWPAMMYAIIMPFLTEGYVATLHDGVWTGHSYTRPTSGFPSKDQKSVEMGLSMASIARHSSLQGVVSTSLLCKRLSRGCWQGYCLLIQPATVHQIPLSAKRGYSLWVSLWVSLWSRSALSSDLILNCRHPFPVGATVNLWLGSFLGATVLYKYIHT